MANVPLNHATWQDRARNVNLLLRVAKLCQHFQKLIKRASPCKTDTVLFGTKAFYSGHRRVESSNSDDVDYTAVFRVCLPVSHRKTKFFNKNTENAKKYQVGYKKDIKQINFTIKYKTNRFHFQDLECY